MDKVIVYDGGHGGKDPGAVDPVQPWEGDQLHTKEEDITLAVALKAASLTTFARPILTRSEDVSLDPDKGLDLYKRADVAVLAKAAAFVSIHCNAATDPRGTGVEVFYYDPPGKALAEKIQRYLVADLGQKDRGVKYGNFGVIRRSAQGRIPAVLVELPFVTNPKDEVLLNDPAYQTRAALAIVKGVSEFLGVQDPNQVMVDVLGHLTVPGVLLNGTTMVPVRTTFEAAGFAVGWDGDTRTVKITRR